MSCKDRGSEGKLPDWAKTFFEIRLSIMDVDELLDGPNMSSEELEGGL